MGIIENDNCKGLCQEQYCDDKYTHFYWVEIINTRYFLVLCEEHYNRLLEGYLNKI